MLRVSSALKIKIESFEALRKGETLVDHGLGRQARNVRVVQPRPGSLAGRALPDHEKGAFKCGHRAHAPDEHLPKHRHRVPGDGTQHAHVHGNVPPANYLLVMVTDSVLDEANLGRAHVGIAGQKALSHAVVSLVRKLDRAALQHAFVVRVWNLEKNAGAVAGARIAANGAPMGQAAQNLDALRHYIMGRGAMKVGDEAKTAGVSLERRVVQATRGGQRHRRRKYTGGDAARQHKRCQNRS